MEILQQAMATVPATEEIISEVDMVCFLHLLRLFQWIPNWNITEEHYKGYLSLEIPHSRLHQPLQCNIFIMPMCTTV